MLQDAPPSPPPSGPSWKPAEDPDPEKGGWVVEFWNHDDTCKPTVSYSFWYQVIIHYKDNSEEDLPKGGGFPGINIISGANCWKDIPPHTSVAEISPGGEGPYEVNGGINIIDKPDGRNLPRGGLSDWYNSLPNDKKSSIDWIEVTFHYKLTISCQHGSWTLYFTYIINFDGSDLSVCDQYWGEDTSSEYNKK